MLYIICYDIIERETSATTVLPSHRKDSLKWSNSFVDRSYIWSTDLHSGPITCDAPLLADIGAVVHAEIEFHACKYSGTCKDRLQV
jgi:hypothetical protein